MYMWHCGVIVSGRVFFLIIGELVSLIPQEGSSFLVFNTNGMGFTVL